jgi:hypothetical protein
MQRRWFREWGWIYLPVSWQGTVLTVLSLAFSAQVFLAVDRNSHSVSDTFYGVFPYFVCCWGITYWIASKTSKRTE